MIELVSPHGLSHIEGFGPRRVKWLQEKIVSEGRWVRPIVIDDENGFVMDGQHRLEVALNLGLRRIPAVRFKYSEVEVWSLRPQKYQFTWSDVVDAVKANRPYPYKTVKHGFPVEIPACDFLLEELR